MSIHRRTSKVTRRSGLRGEAWLAGWIAGAKCVVLVLQDLLLKQELTTIGQITAFLATAWLTLKDGDGK